MTTVIALINTHLRCMHMLTAYTAQQMFKKMCRWGEKMYFIVEMSYIVFPDITMTMLH